ncbi:MAG: type II toxin-antitoxin system VapC family toxin [Brachymonas sp.]
MEISNLCLDTNTYSAFLAGKAAAVKRISQAEHIWLPAPVLGELRAGFAKGSKAAANELLLQEFLTSQHVHVIAIDEAVTRGYAKIFDQLRRDGSPIPTNDLWIAACVMHVGFPLHSLDAHFKSVRGIDLISS